MKLCRLLAVALPFLLAAPLTAQSFAVDGSVNVGVGKGGEFKDDDLASVRVAASLTKRLNDRLGLFGELAADPASLDQGSKASCIPSSRGGCKPAFPDFTGASAILGLESGRGNSRFEVRAGLGGGLVSANHTRVGAIVTQADVGLFPLWHAGIVLGWRATMIPKFEGDRLSLRTVVVGLRLR